LLTTWIALRRVFPDVLVSRRICVWHNLRERFSCERFSTVFSVPTMGAFMSLTEPNSAAAILQFAIEIMPPPIPPAGATRDETSAGRRLLSFDALFSCAVPDDRSKNVAGTWIRFMTRLATEMGKVLAFPKRSIRK
jgi:hypothetical protein